MGRGAWRSKTQSGLIRTRVSHLRCAAALAHAFVRFRPGGESGFRLAPMRDGSLITPIQKMWHGSAVRTCGHELTHTLMSIPGCHRPEGPASIGQERAALKSGRLLYLPHRAERMKYKERDETKGPDSQAGKADEYHNQLTTPAILLPEGMADMGTEPSENSTEAVLPGFASHTNEYFIGSVIGPYHLLQLIGEGGMGDSSPCRISK
jgi:hypothetical protein